MASDRSNWPADFPADCPPAAALAADGVFYRVVKCDPPALCDFVSQYHQNRKLADRNIRQGIVSQCHTMGLSVFANESDAVARARRYPQIGRLIARLTLAPDSGKIQPTPRHGDSHHTWWLPEGYNPTDAAIVVDNP